MSYFTICYEDKLKTTFMVEDRVYAYKWMPFDLCNKPASFQHYINDTLREFLNNFYTIYLDNILIYSEFEAEHEIYIKRILQKLREVGL